MSILKIKTNMSNPINNRKHQIKKALIELHSEIMNEIEAISKIIRYVTEGRIPEYHFKRDAAEGLIAMKAVESIPELKKMLNEEPHYYTYIEFIYDSTHGGPESTGEYEWPKVVKETIEKLERTKESL